MKYLIIVMALLIAVPVVGQRKKKEDETGVVATFSEGIAYALPRTVLKIQVTAVREKFEPGPYAAYAEQLLGVQNAKTRPYTNWKIASVEIHSFSEPDPDQVYKAMGYGAYLISLAPNGCLAGINSHHPVPALPLITSNNITQKPDPDDGFSFAYFSDTPFYTSGDSTNNFRPGRVSVEKKAAEAAQRILNARLNQYELASLRIDGEYPDGKAYEVSLAELKRTEDNYIMLFVGRTTYKTETYSFDYVPIANSKNPGVIFRISDENGIVPANDLSGKPVMIEFGQEENLTAKYNAKAASDNPNAGHSGVYYRMPGEANIMVTYDMKTLATARATIAQFGVVAPLPEELLDGEFSVEIHPETGAIKSVTPK